VTLNEYYIHHSEKKEMEIYFQNNFMNTKHITIIALLIIFIIFTGYKVFGESTPTREELKANRIQELQEDNARIKTHNDMSEDICQKESEDKPTAIDKAQYNLDCIKKEYRPLINIDEVIKKEFGTGSTNS